jgi:hypothetical protein
MRIQQLNALISKLSSDKASSLSLSIHIRYISLVLFSFLCWMRMSLQGTSATIWPVIPAPDGAL